MSNWEYRVIQYGDGGGRAAVIEQMCNELGTNGWELVGTSPVVVQHYQPSGYGYDMNPSTTWYMVFKRAVVANRR